MSHNVEHYTYPENVNKTEVQAELDHYAAMQDWQEGCQGLYHDIRWLWDKVYSSYEEAEKAIEKLDNDDKRYDRISSNARKSFVEKYSLFEYGKRVGKIINEMEI